nr:alpha-amylase family glycosyl hydrolase [Candidatus Microthrix sp.]
MTTELASWWRSAVIYQIYPAVFGHLRQRGGRPAGVIDGLRPHRHLGVDAIWLSPIFTSPMVDHGYDVSDYRDIDPSFGTLDDFDGFGRPGPRSPPAGDPRLGAQPFERCPPLVYRITLIAGQPQA